MSRRVGSKAKWDEQQADYLDRSEVTVQGCTEEIGISHGAFSQRPHGESRSRQLEKASLVASYEAQLVEVGVMGLREKAEVAPATGLPFKARVICGPGDRRGPAAIRVSRFGRKAYHSDPTHRQEHRSCDVDHRERRQIDSGHHAPVLRVLR